MTTAFPRIHYCCWSMIFLTLTHAVPVSWSPDVDSSAHSDDLPPDKVCTFENITYTEGQTHPTSNPCEICRCQPPGFECSLRTCDVKPGCKALHQAGKCCPQYICDCQRNGRTYGNGEKVEEPNPCNVCYCRGGEVQCTGVTCYTRTDCEPHYVPGKCCPKYDHCPPIETKSKPPLLSTELTTPGSELMNTTLGSTPILEKVEDRSPQVGTLEIIEIHPTSVPRPVLSTDISLAEDNCNRQESECASEKSAIATPTAKVSSKNSDDVDQVVSDTRNGEESVSTTPETSEDVIVENRKANLKDSSPEIVTVQAENINESSTSENTNESIAKSVNDTELTSTTGEPSEVEVQGNSTYSEDLPSIITEIEEMPNSTNIEDDAGLSTVTEVKLLNETSPNLTNLEDDADVTSYTDVTSQPGADDDSTNLENYTESTFTTRELPEIEAKVTATDRPEEYNINENVSMPMGKYDDSEFFSDHDTNDTISLLLGLNNDSSVDDVALSEINNSSSTDRTEFTTNENFEPSLVTDETIPFIIETSSQETLPDSATSSELISPATDQRNTDEQPSNTDADNSTESVTYPNFLTTEMTNNTTDLEDEEMNTTTVGNPVERTDAVTINEPENIGKATEITPSSESPLVRSVSESTDSPVATIHPDVVPALSKTLSDQTENPLQRNVGLTTEENPFDANYAVDSSATAPHNEETLIQNDPAESSRDAENVTVAKEKLRPEIVSDVTGFPDAREPSSTESTTKENDGALTITPMTENKSEAMSDSPYQDGNSTDSAFLEEDPMTEKTLQNSTDGEDRNGQSTESGAAIVKEGINDPSSETVMNSESPENASSTGPSETNSETPQSESLSDDSKVGELKEDRQVLPDNPSEKAIPSSRSISEVGETSTEPASIVDSTSASTVDTYDIHENTSHVYESEDTPREYTLDGYEGMYPKEQTPEKLKSSEVTTEMAKITLNESIKSEDMNHALADFLRKWLKSSKDHLTAKSANSESSAKSNSDEISASVINALTTELLRMVNNNSDSEAATRRKDGPIARNLLMVVPPTLNLTSKRDGLERSIHIVENHSTANVANISQPTIENSAILNPNDADSPVLIKNLLNDESLAPVLSMISDQLQFLKIGEEQPIYIEVPPEEDKRNSQEGIIVTPTSAPIIVDMVKPGSSSVVDETTKPLKN